MSLSSFLEQLTFNYVQPHQVLAVECPPEFEIENTHVVGVDRTLLEPLCQIPKMSSFATACLIHYLVSQMPGDQVFLNIGLWHGFTLFAGMLGHAEKTCIGVDNFSNLISKDTQTFLTGSPLATFEYYFSKYKSDKHRFYHMDYRQYFREHTEPIGVYIYDADHAYQSQIDGLKLAEPFLQKGAYILVDDTNWPHVYHANLAFMKHSPHQYRVVFDTMTAQNAHPTFWNGLMLLQKLS